MRSEQEIEKKLRELERRHEEALRRRDNAVEDIRKRYWDTVADQTACQEIALKWVLKYEWITKW